MPVLTDDTEVIPEEVKVEEKHEKVVEGHLISKFLTFSFIEISTFENMFYRRSQEKSFSQQGNLD